MISKFKNSRCGWKITIRKCSGLLISIISLLALFSLSAEQYLAQSNSAPAAARFLGPRPYKSQADSPFLDLIREGRVFLENFEKGNRKPPKGYPAWNASGQIIPPGFEGIIDSVDGDDPDGRIDGFGSRGHSFFSETGSVTFSFDASTTGSLPSYVGIVWTDGEPGTTTFEPYGPNGETLGKIGPVAIADASIAGTTAEDRFFGVINQAGVSGFKISNTRGGIEVDHLQYGELVRDNASNAQSIPDTVNPGTPDTIRDLRESAERDRAQADREQREADTYRELANNARQQAKRTSDPVHRDSWIESAKRRDATAKEIDLEIARLSALADEKDARAARLEEAYNRRYGPK